MKGAFAMGRKASTITLSSEDRVYLETQTKARTIQAQTVARARILLLKSENKFEKYKLLLSYLTL